MKSGKKVRGVVGSGRAAAGGERSILKLMGVHHFSAINTAYNNYV